MAYGEKYNGELKDYFDRTIEVKILEKDFTGSSTEIKLAGISQTINGDDENLFLGIVSTSISVGVVSETNFQYIDLYTGNNRKFKIQVYRDSVLYWTGWITPDLFTEPYTNTPYITRITARCGLVELETIDFDLINVKSQDEILQEAITKITESGDVVYVGVNSFEENHVTTESPLSQTYVNCDRYSDMTYKEVIEDLCRIYNARIYQKDGSFWFVSNHEFREEFDWVKYDGVQTVADSGTYDNEILIGRTQDDKFANLDQQLNILPGWQRIKVLKDLGYRSSILENTDFETWDEATGSLLADWIYSVTGLCSRTNVKDNFAASFNFNNSTPSTGYYMSQQINNFVGNKHSLKFSIDFKIIDNVETSGQFWLKFENDSGSSKQYLQSNGTWTTTESYINFQDVEIKNSLKSSVQNYEFGALNIPLSGSLKVYIYASDKGTLIVDSLRVQLTNPISLIPYEDDDIEEDMYIGDFSYIPDETEVLTGDLPDKLAFVNFVSSGSELNEQHIYDGGLYLDSSRNQVTKNWSYQAESYTYKKSLAFVMSAQKKYLTSSPYWVLTGTILAKTLKIDSAVVDYQINNRKYLINNGSIDLERCFFNGTMIETGRYSGSPWILADGTWNDDGIWVDSDVWNDSAP